ncbi:MAG: hypothetical protein MZW92_62585 [Comamonadaceae bacterium]|nr:hypothetical protein [Comamonadaceae bacterium]
MALRRRHRRADDVRRCRPARSTFAAASRSYLAATVLYFVIAPSRSTAIALFIEHRVRGARHASPAGK